ncbi:MAG: HNH endonuclease [Bacteroidales bacterium]|nr:HNH endonuclease [Bacteroidales bacterium]
MLEQEMLRLKIFDWLNDLIAFNGSNILNTNQIDGYIHNGEPVFLRGGRGIWKPKQLKYPISILSNPDSIYQEDDGFISESLLHYSYEGTDPNIWTNVLLRETMVKKIPLIFLHLISKGKYFVHLPVYIVNDEPKALRFTVAAESQFILKEDDESLEDPKTIYIRQEYATREVKQRLYQQTFREQVLEAYRNSCAICRLKHRELLDAAHIIPDAEGGKPYVSNGLSLCKIHHTAFDQNIIGISPDYLIHVRTDILEEIDGPMLKHGIQEMHNSNLIIPRSKSSQPNKDWLAQRYEKFLRVG